MYTIYPQKKFLEAKNLEMGPSVLTMATGKLVYHSFHLWSQNNDGDLSFGAVMNIMMGKYNMLSKYILF